MTILEGEVVKVETSIPPPPAFSPRAAKPLTTVADRVCHWVTSQAKKPTSRTLRTRDARTFWFSSMAQSTAVIAIEITTKVPSVPETSVWIRPKPAST